MDEKGIGSRMREDIQRQLEEKWTAGTGPYSRPELEWLLVHIGDPDPAIRDDLVYNSFCSAIMNHFLTKEDLLFLVDSVLQRDLLTYKMPEQGDATLVRSFSSLLLALILDVDQTADSPYHQSLSTDQLQTIFGQTLLYLQQETDSTGWDKEKGWVHAFAYGAELLLYAGLHKEFPQERMEELLETLTIVLKQREALFTAGEERRLAFMVTQLLIQEKIQQTQLCHWIEKLDFPNQSPQDYFALLNLENLLSTIYLHLEKEGLLETELKDSILNFWKGY